MEVSLGKKTGLRQTNHTAGDPWGVWWVFPFYRIPVPIVGTIDHIQDPVAQLPNNSQTD